MGIPRPAPTRQTGQTSRSSDSPVSYTHLDVYKRQAGDFPQIVGHSGGQQVGADKVRRTVTGTLLVAPADITILLAGRCV